MKRRWFIRSLFMVPILLCIVGWGWSVTHSTWVGYHTNHYLLFAETETGGVGLRGTIIESEVTNGWTFENNSQDERHLLNPEYISSLGFFVRHFGSVTILVVPYWFLILVFSGLLWLVWRRTPPKPTGGAFPVEVENSN